MVSQVTDLKIEKFKRSTVIQKIQNWKMVSKKT